MGRSGGPKTSNYAGLSLKLDRPNICAVYGTHEGRQDLHSYGLQRRGPLWSTGGATGHLWPRVCRRGIVTRTSSTLSVVSQRGRPQGLPVVQV